MSWVDSWATMTKQRLAPDADEHVLDCAARLFHARGFEATTVRDIARAAGMLPGSLHYRYPTKGTLLLALMQRGVAIDRAAIDDALQDEADPVERLRLALRAHLRVILGHDAARAVLFEWRPIEPESRAAMVVLRDEYDRFWAQLIDEAQRAGCLVEGIDRTMLRFLLFGAVNWTSMWYAPGGGLSPDEIADAFWRVVADGMVARRPTA